MKGGIFYGTAGGAFGDTVPRYVDVSDLNAIEDSYDWLSGLGQAQWPSASGGCPPGTSPGCVPVPGHGRRLASAGRRPSEPRATERERRGREPQERRGGGGTSQRCPPGYEVVINYNVGRCERRCPPGTEREAESRIGGRRCVPTGRRPMRGLGALSSDTVWMAQAFLNEELAKRRLAEVPMDGNLTKATCEGLVKILKDVQAGGKVDPAFADFMKTNGALFDAPCAQVLGSGTVTSSRPPEPLPPQPQPPRQEFELEQCFIDFGDESEIVADIQEQINAQLDEEGYEPIPVTGQWDGKTCGAIFFLKGRFHPEPVPPCPEYQVPLECAEVVEPRKKGGGKMMVWALGGLVLALAGGGVYWATQR